MFISEKVEVRETEKGKAIFANDKIKKEELIFSMEGKIINKADKYSIQIEENKHLSGQGNIHDYLNHSCIPNAYFDFNSLHFRTLRDIKKNEEITFHYLTTEWKMSYTFKCECGSKKCLHFVKGFKYLTLEQKKELETLLSPYLKKKLYEELRKDID